MIGSDKLKLDKNIIQNKIQGKTDEKISNREDKRRYTGI